MARLHASREVLEFFNSAQRPSNAVFQQDHLVGCMFQRDNLQRGIGKNGRSQSKALVGPDIGWHLKRDLS